MPPAASRPIPKFLQIVGDVRQAILSGELPPGAEVPSERQIAARWRVARPTAARALQALRAEGLVEPRRGAGTFVRVPAPRHPVPGEAAPRAEPAEAAEAGEEMLRAALAPAPDDVAALIGVPAGAQLPCRHRIARAGGLAVDVSTTWYGPDAAEVAPRLLVPEPIAEGDLRHLEAAGGRRAVHGTDEVRARSAGPAEARVFGLAEGEAVLSVRRVLRDAAGAVVLVRDSVYPPPGVVRFDWAVI